MNNQDLNKILKSTPVPERSAKYWEQFPSQVTRAVRAGSCAKRAEKSEPRWFPRLAWAGGIAFACAIFGFVVGHGTAQKNDSTALLKNEKMLREVLSLFPNRVRAIVQTDSGPQLVLSDEADVPASTPIWVKISEGKKSQSAVTFSGQEVQIGNERITVLSDGKGGVILVGTNFVWSSTENASKTAEKFEAHPLGSLRM